MGFCNIVALTNYEPFSGAFRYGTLIAIGVGVIAGPFLTYFGSVREKAVILLLGILLPVLCAVPGLLLYLNGKDDSSPLQFHEGTVIRREIAKVKNSTVYKIRVQLNQKPPHQMTIWTSKEKFEMLKEGASLVGIPAKAGNFGIPWRVKSEPIRLVRP